MSVVHSVRGHIVIDHLAVVLFFLLDVVQGLAGVVIPELENTYVVQRRGVLLSGEGVCAQVAVVFLVGGLGGAVNGGKGGQRLIPARGRGGNRAVLSGSSAGMAGRAAHVRIWRYRFCG